MDKSTLLFSRNEKCLPPEKIRKQPKNDPRKGTRKTKALSGALHFYAARSSFPKAAHRRLRRHFDELGIKARQHIDEIGLRGNHLFNVFIEHLALAKSPSFCLWRISGTLARGSCGGLNRESTSKRSPQLLFRAR